MTTNSKIIFLSILYLGLGSLSACTNTKETSAPPTLADIDVEQQKKPQKKAVIEKRSQEEVRRAYQKYIENAPQQDTSRQMALTRLAQLELELSNSLFNEDHRNQIIDQKVTQTLSKTVTLLETTLKDYPDANGNDKVLYQLAQAYGRLGRHDESTLNLSILVKKYPRSPYYSESQFRLAENAFVRGDYITAEDAYTEVILAPDSEKFYEKSLFKRGWSRYKQELYPEAVDDYIDAINYRNFEAYEELSETDKTQFDEYFRALGFAFSYQGNKGWIRNYFNNRENFKFIFETYNVVSDIYLAQSRYSDAATVLGEYAQYNRTSRKTPIAEIKVISAWQEGGFISRSYSAIENFYRTYKPKTVYWNTVDDEATLKLVQDKLRTYITQVSSYYHSRYQNNGNTADFTQARIWYERYLKHYSSYANQDNIYALFGELLLQANQTEKALEYFQFAAYDGNIILDKSSAYSTIVLSGKLIDSSKKLSLKQRWLDQHLTYAQRFVELYPNDKRSQGVAISASERAFKTKNYDATIALINHVSDSTDEKTIFETNNLKARAFLELQQFADAEAVYVELLNSRLINQNTAKTIRDSLSLAIYRQAEIANRDGRIDMALNHFTRIGSIAPNSKLAPTSLYDAIALSISHENWQQAIGLIEEFKARYPKHKLNADVSKKLSVAYLKSDQKDKAAIEFERIAQIGESLEIKMAAQWQAAELYESRDNIGAAIRAYRDYAHTYKVPFEQNMEAMYKLSQLYQKTGDKQKRYFWQNRIRQSNQKATKSVKTDRTTFIASTTTLHLARQKKQEFVVHRLVEPIEKNLKLKKSTMQDSVKLFGQASSYGIEEITTEATNAIGDLYFEFSQSLLESERPKDLNGEELEQYEILLEDQAFPFEEKAIEFYEVNLSRTRDGVYNDWIARSFSRLQELFPVRYERKGKIDVFDNR